MSHTPGPWVVWGMSANDGEAEVISNEDGSKTVCWTADTYNEDKDKGEVTDEDRANGRLIAAAPELLIASKEMLSALSRCYFPDPHPDDKPHWDKAADCVKALGKAIAKAEGVTP